MTLVQRRPQPLARTTVHRGGVLVAWLGGSGDAAALRWALSWAHQTARDVTVLVTGQAATPGSAYRSHIAAALGVPVGMTEAPFMRILERSGDPVAALLTAGIRADVLVIPTGGPAPIPNRSLGRTVERVVARHPGAVATLIRSYLTQGRDPGRDPSLLTPREEEVLKLIAEGHSGKDIADMLFLSPKTVERHRANLLEKLGMKDRLELTRYAIRTGLIEP